MSAIIETKKLTKEFEVHEKEPGFFGSLKSLYKRDFQVVKAVTSVDISIEQGELVGFIGPNGAGKTTTLKMLSGLLYPTSGEALVMGHVPWERQKDYLKKVSLVMGQKAQLWWDLPLYDSLLLQKELYEVPAKVFNKSLSELIELLELEEFLKVQVRKLSLGQRMRGELAAAFIYHPEVVFLDEPTIGLDIVVQKKIREFLKDYQSRHGATIILTSHYLEDVSALARRLIIIDHDKVAYDGATDDLIKKYADHKRIVLTFGQSVERSDLESYGKVLDYEDLRATILVPRAETSVRAASILTKLPVVDVAIEEDSLEDVARELFTNRDYA